MSTPINHQIINHNGQPAFVLVPFEEYEEVRQLLSVKDGIPHDVVMSNALHNVPMIKAWREYLELTQDELADMAGMKQSALARLESNIKSKPRLATLKRLAKAMNINVVQLEE